MSSKYSNNIQIDENTLKEGLKTFKRKLISKEIIKTGDDRLYDLLPYDLLPSILRNKKKF